MVKKTYKTYFLKGLDLHLKDEEGASMVIVFRGGIQIDSTAKYTTSDPKIQEALESCSGFGRDYYLESETDLTPVEKPAAVKDEKKAAPAPEKPIMSEVKGSERFRNLVEMKNRIAELGIVLEEGANYAQAKAAAIKAGYDFQIQK